MLKSNGTLFTINYLKQSRLLITRYLCGRPILVNDHFISTKGGFPRKFYFLRKFIDSGNIDQIRFCLTLMNISKAIEPREGEKLPIDFSTITKKGAEKFYTIPNSFIVKFIDQFGLEFPKHLYSFKDFSLNLKAGPHGPTTITIAHTVKFLTEEQMEWMSALSEKRFVKN